MARPHPKLLMPVGKFPAACRERVFQFSPLIPRCLRRGSLFGSLSTALELVDVEPPVGLRQEGLAVLTEKQRGPVEVSEPVRGPHDTLRLFTVNESEGVCQFVNSHLGGALIQGIRGRSSPILLPSKPVKGDYRCPTSQLGFTKDVGEDRNEEVNVHYP